MMSKPWENKPWEANSNSWKNPEYKKNNEAWKNPPYKAMNATWQDKWGTREEMDNMDQQTDELSPGLYESKGEDVYKVIEYILNILGVKQKSWNSVGRKHLRINISDLPPNPTYIVRLITYAANFEYRQLRGVRNSLELFPRNLSNRIIKLNRIDLDQTIRDVRSDIVGPLYRNVILPDKEDKKLFKLYNTPNVDTINSLMKNRKNVDDFISNPKYDFLKEFLFLRDLDALFMVSLLFSYIQIGELYLDLNQESNGYVDAINDISFMSNTNLFLKPLRVDWLPVNQLYSNDLFNRIIIEYPEKYELIDKQGIVRYYVPVKNFKSQYGSNLTLTIDRIANTTNDNGLLVAMDSTPVPHGIDRDAWNNIFSGIGAIIN